MINPRLKERERQKRWKGVYGFVRPIVARMHFYDSLMLPTLFIIALYSLTLDARRLSPLIEDDWARRPHRAAGKFSFVLSQL